MRVSKEFKLGILVVLSLLLFFIAFNFLKGYGTFGKSREFYVEFDASHGLEVFDDVQMNGVRIGEVSEVDINQYEASKIIVKFKVEDGGLQIPRESELWLISSDILGTKVLDLRIPHDSLLAQPDDLYMDGDTFFFDKVKVALSFNDELENQFLPIKERTDKLVQRVEQIVLDVSMFWDSSAAYTFDESMYDTRDAIEQYKEMSNNITALINAEKTPISYIKKDMISVQEYFKRLTLTAEISRNFSDIVDYLTDTTFSETMNETSKVFASLQSHMKALNDGEGSIGKFANTPELGDHIKAIDSSLTELKNHLEARPKDFFGFSLFGLRADGYQPEKRQKPYLDDMLDSLHDGKKVEYEK